MALERNLVIEQGDTLTQDWQWVSKVGEVPVDLTGCLLILQVRKGKSPESPVLLELSTVNGGIVMDTPEEGRFRIFLSMEGTYGLTGIPAEPTSSRAYYDLIARFGEGGESRKLLKGEVVFYRSTTYLN